jgi:Ulp1 family protease
MNTYFFKTLEEKTEDKILRAIRKQMPDMIPTYWLIPINLVKLKHWALAIIVNCDGKLTDDTKNCVIPEIVNDGLPCIIYLDSLFSMCSTTL